MILILNSSEFLKTGSTIFFKQITIFIKHLNCVQTVTTLARLQAYFSNLWDLVTKLVTLWTKYQPTLIQMLQDEAG